MLHSGSAGWLHEQHRCSRVSHVFKTIPKHTTYCSSVAVHWSVWAQSCTCECSNYGCGSTIITFQLKLTRKSQTIAPDAVVSKRNVSSLGLLHSTDSTEHVTANWFYSVLQFAKTDKDRFPSLFPFLQLFESAPQAVDWPLWQRCQLLIGWNLGKTNILFKWQFLSISLHTPAIFGWSDSHPGLHTLHKCFSSKGKTSLLFLPVRHRFLGKLNFWRQGEEQDTIVLCVLGKKKSAKCDQTSVQTVVYKVCIYRASVPHGRITCQRADLQIETKGVKNEGGLSSWRTSNSKCKQHVRVHHQNACKKTMCPSLLSTTLPEMCRNAEAWLGGRGSEATVIVRAALWSSHLLDDLLLNINPPFVPYFHNA